MPNDITDLQAHPIQVRSVTQTIARHKERDLVLTLLRESDSDAVIAYETLVAHVDVLLASWSVRSIDDFSVQAYARMAKALLRLICVGKGCYELCDASHQKRSGWCRSQMGHEWRAWGDGRKSLE